MGTRILALAGAAAIFCAACGSDSNGTPDAGNDPTEVRFGDTVLVVVLNPTVNDANSATVPTPGTARAGVTLTTDDDVTTTTDATGIAVLGPLTPGTRMVTLSGSGLSGSFSVTMADGELHEIALAADGAQAEIMVEIDYKSDEITELSPTMSNSAVNDALKISDTVVFFQGGTYEGDLDFSGSRVTLFGAGVLGGEVVLNGNVTVSGSDSRIRGTQITGNLTIPASGVGLSFSQVDGATQSEGSDATFLANALCGGVDLTGSGTIVLGNAGASPLTTCP
jgi:hypothetical protein